MALKKRSGDTVTRPGDTREGAIVDFVTAAGWTASHEKSTGTAGPLGSGECTAGTFQKGLRDICSLIVNNAGAAVEHVVAVTADDLGGAARSGQARGNLWAKRDRTALGHYSVRASDGATVVAAGDSVQACTDHHRIHPHILHRRIGMAEAAPMPIDPHTDGDLAADDTGKTRYTAATDYTHELGMRIHYSKC
jgi:hypothetical protein